VDAFAFIIHPIDPRRDIGRKYPFLARIVNDWIIYQFSPLWPPVYLSEVQGVVSAASGKEIKGWLIACPLTPKHFFQLPEKRVYRKIIETGCLAEKLGAKILGLGAYTSVVGDAGKTIARALDIPVTTGDAYTVSMAVRAVEEAAGVMDLPLKNCTAAVVGATGAIGRACAALMGQRAGELLLIARHEAELVRLQDDLAAKGCQAAVRVSTDMASLREAQLILTVTSATHAVIEPAHLQPGSVVCDVARPRDVSLQVAAMREDVLVIDGGMVEVPGSVDFHFDFGFPPGKAYACMAETMALTLEGRFEDYTLGKELELEKIKEITDIADKHGFRLSGFRSFERAVTEEQIDRVRKNAQLGRRHS